MSNSGDYSANLTLKSEIVRPVTEVNPVPGHDLVVFERIGNDGHRFHSLLPPEREMRKGLLGVFGLTNFVAYAVTKDNDLRYEFTREVTTWDQAGSFILRCTLTFGVSDPRLLVEQLVRDPLKRLERMAGDLFANAASRVDWVTIENQGLAFERQVLASQSVNASGVQASNLAILREFAAGRGFNLRDVHLSVVFPPEFGEVIRRQREERQKQLIRASTAETERLELELRSRLSQVETVQANLRGLINSAGTNLDRMLGNIADGVTSPGALRNVLVELLDTFSQVSRAVSAAGVGGNADPALALRERVLNALPEGSGAVEAHPSSRYTREVVALVADLSCAQSEKDQLLSATFHLLGELLLGPRADGETVKRYRSDLRSGFEAVLPALKNQRQHQLLSELVSLEPLTVTVPGART
jgi:hypothetical protein